MIYKIPVSWQMYGVVEVEADSLEDAIERAMEDDIPLPTDGDYVDASWEVDVEIAEIYSLENNA